MESSFEGDHSFPSGHLSGDMEGLLIRFCATVHPTEVLEARITVGAERRRECRERRFSRSLVRVRGSDKEGLKVTLIETPLRARGTEACCKGSDLARRVDNLEGIVIDRAEKRTLAPGEIDHRGLLLSREKLTPIKALEVAF